ncbi:MAG: acyl-CoA thioesterase II [Acidobacteria bacterium]|nr:MAG: acyl-CoA thioesterase II [Acidobacteriota bacterium]REK11322.1 MAG: acyl-CoA thioesterase II [Acidobacteriota bacterium]
MLQFAPEDRAVAHRRFLAALELETLGDDGFTASAGRDGSRLFGGQLAAQALVAAARTLPEPRQEDRAPRRAHSLHAYFYLPGRPGTDLRIGVERIRDGRSFSARRVGIRQAERLIFELAASFTTAQPGFEHGEPAPTVPPPEECGDREERRLEVFGEGWLELGINAVEVRLTQPELLDPPPGTAPVQRNWVRFPCAHPGGAPEIQDAMLLFASDRGLLSTAALPHGLQWGRSAGASLDHALWIHEPVDLAQWHLFVLHSPRAVHGRALMHTRIYDREGRHVASAAQEALMRSPAPARS